VEDAAVPGTELELRRVATLDVAAASGLVRVGDRLWVAADDELGLALYAAADARPLGRVPLWPGELPVDHAARKRAKPDVEALVVVEGAGVCALGSGSKPTRQRGACVRGDGEIVRFDLSSLHAALERALGAGQLNLEGAAVSGGWLRLLQRGNGAAGVNAVIDLDLGGVQAALAAGAPWSDRLLRAIHPIELPRLDGVPLGFTDASPLPDGRLVFVAAAEAGADTYEDGACAGSAVGILSADGAPGLVRLVRVATRAKLEGVHAEVGAAGALQLLLVADADDPAIPSDLFAATLP
jgi:hypothetical protein